MFIFFSYIAQKKVCATNNMSTRRTKLNIRSIHATFSAFYIVIGGILAVAPIICVNYEAIFQSGLTVFMVGMAYLMVSMTMIGKEVCLTRGEFYLLNRHIILLVFSAGAHILASAYYLWNLIKILLLCPTFHNPNNGSLPESMSITSHSASLLSIAGVDRAVKTTTISEDQAFQIARAAKICRNEYGFAMCLTILLLLADIICLVTIFVYLWIKRKIRCLYPNLVPRCT